MWYAKFIEKSDNALIYNGKHTLEQVVYYVMNSSKIYEDGIRVATSNSICAGCSPFPFSKMDEVYPESVIFLMETNIESFYKNYDDVLRHRIVAFPSCEYVLPEDINILGRKLVEYYSRNGFIACYGVHRDTYNYHVHVIVCTVSFLDGHKFNIFMEYNKVHDIIRAWNKCLQDKLSNPDIAEKYANRLFGDAYMPAQLTAIGAKEQIKNYKKYHDSHKKR